jgi:predicted phosphatase
VFAHSDKLKEMAECMLKLLKSNGTIIIEVQYLLNTLQDLTFDNIYHEHYNYWSLTTLVNFFKQFKAKIIRAERINSHGGSLRVYVKKDRSSKVEQSVEGLLKKEEEFGMTKYETYKKIGEKIYTIRKNVKKNIKNLKTNGKKIIGYGSPAKATTALNFFGISKEIEYIVDDNKLKHGKFLPGVKIPITSKSNIKQKPDYALVLAWNFMDEIKRKNSDLAHKFINIKDLEI